MVSERPRDDDELVGDDRLGDEESGGEGAAPSGGGGRLGILRRLASAPSLLGRARRPAMFGGAIVMLLAWTWMLWQFVASTTALSASVETLATAMQERAASPAPAGSGAPPSTGHAPDATAGGPTFAVDEVVRDDASVGGEPHARTEPPAAEAPAEAEPVVVTVLGRPALTDGADLWDCLHFESWDQADQVYRANLPQDPNILDFDANGVPCESLPGAP